jgi:hypothetical protein
VVMGMNSFQSWVARQNSVQPKNLPRLWYLHHFRLLTPSKKIMLAFPTSPITAMAQKNEIPKNIIFLNNGCFGHVKIPFYSHGLEESNGAISILIRPILKKQLLQN